MNKVIVAAVVNCDSLDFSVSVIGVMPESVTYQQQVLPTYVKRGV